MTNAGFSFMRGQIESLRSMLRALYASEGDITHAELGVKFLALEAMMQRAEIASATDAPAPFPMAALELKIAELKQAMCLVAIDYWAYQALPQPDPHRNHNQPQIASPGARDAVQTLLEANADADMFLLRDTVAAALEPPVRTRGETEWTH